MIEFAGYIFDEHKASIVCTHILDGHPILLFVHDSDGDVQFMCGAAGHALDNAKVIGITHVLEHLRSLTNMPIVDPGFLAKRSERGEDWVVHPIEP